MRQSVGKMTLPLIVPSHQGLLNQVLFESCRSDQDRLQSGKDMRVLK